MSDFNPGFYGFRVRRPTSPLGVGGTTPQPGVDEIDDFLTRRDGGGDVVQSHGAAGAAETIDLANGNVHALTLDANCTITLTAVSSGRGRSGFLEITTPGSFTITWPGSVEWGTAGDPDLSAAGVYFVALYTRDGGTTWYGFAQGGAGGASALDDLTDVTITAPAENDTLRYIGGQWVNDDRRWEPVTDNPGAGPELVWDGDDLVMEWKEY